MLITLKELLKSKVEKRQAVGAFDTFDTLTTEAIISAAEKENLPVIVMVCDFSFDTPGGEHFLKYTYERACNATVPVCLHLDHGPSFEACAKAIHYGCSSVMIDGSELPYEENIALTKKVVEMAHACGVSVEAEIGHVAGHEADAHEEHLADESAYTILADAVDFADKTGVDALAVAIGTVHGVYKGEPKLDFNRLSEIRSNVSIPLVMHGGSGLREEHYVSAVKNGMNKINFYTGMSLAAAKVARDFLSADEFADVGDMFDAAAGEIRRIVGEHLRLFARVDE